MEKISFLRLTQASSEAAQAFSRWENDPDLIPFSRPNDSQEDIEKREPVTVEQLAQRLEHQAIFLIYLGGQLVGEMSYQIDPAHLFKKVNQTAWIGITIGEKKARGKGIGTLAMQFLEQQIVDAGLKRIELGVFEFNTSAIALYKKLGFSEIGRIPDFTFWKGKKWQDIRMEKFPAG